MRANTLENVLERVDASGDCWEWTGYIDPAGYGRINFGGGNRLRYVHRVLYEGLVGPIPNGLVSDHLCRVRHCVNPDHLEVVTAAENTRRGLAGKSRQLFDCDNVRLCREGHRIEGENAKKCGDTRERCRLCDIVRARELRASQPRRRR